ncbi:unnamed protein product [Symbiodinium microadriaticum]|nr:unnamed protein product [Symbiodinium microadriaticum]
MTYVHTASYVEMSDMLRSCSTASHCSGTYRIASAASCSGFDKLWSVLAAPEVVSRNDVMSIDNWLQRIRLAPPLSKSCGEDDNRKASCDGAECTAYELNMTYDAIDDMEICCGNAAEPRLPIDEAKQSAVKVYCTVDAKLLRDIYVRRDWFISALRCRPEMCDSEYPPLTEEEMELAQRVMAFVASESSDGDSETILEWK